MLLFPGWGDQYPHGERRKRQICVGVSWRNHVMWPACRPRGRGRAPWPGRGAGVTWGPRPLPAAARRFYKSLEMELCYCLPPSGPDQGVRSTVGLYSHSPGGQLGKLRAAGTEAQAGAGNISEGRTLPRPPPPRPLQRQTPRGAPVGKAGVGIWCGPPATSCQAADGSQAEPQSWHLPGAQSHKLRVSSPRGTDTAP